jgi:hypothetical protein
MKVFNATAIPFLLTKKPHAPQRITNDLPFPRPADPVSNMSQRGPPAKSINPGVDRAFAARGRPMSLLASWSVRESDSTNSSVVDVALEQGPFFLGFFVEVLNGELEVSGSSIHMDGRCSTH